LQLVDGHTLFDYNVGLNEIIQILVQRKPTVVPVTTELTNDELEHNEPDNVRCAQVEMLNISGIMMTLTLTISSAP